MSSCDRKRRYVTRAAAETALRMQPARDRDVHAYRCGECGLFHLGHAPGRGTGLRGDGRYGKQRLAGVDVFVWCPGCEAFTARMGIAVAKCERCLTYVLPAGLRR